MHKLRNTDYFPTAGLQFHCDRVILSPNVTVTPHSHEFIELVYIEEGSGRHSYKGNTSRIGAGDVFMIEPDVEHAYYVDASGPLIVHNLLIGPAFLQQEIQSLSALSSFIEFYFVEPMLRGSFQFKTFLSLEYTQQVHLMEQLKRISEEYRDQPVGYSLAIKSQLVTLFIFLTRCYENKNGPKAILSRDHDLMDSICAFIHKHYAQPLSLDQVSRLCGMSTASFSAKFKKHAGKTMIEYRNDIRLSQALQLITVTDMKMSEISSEVGFEDVSFFNKQFKQMYGQSPSQFRKRQPSH
ncbi:hypothetical protein SY83_02200 [Paenibacillus swuensis]|uniref:HTH araC/xylS-type domain-containing protein n=1 Tax=Paenibacillus swuensis TaxID=1178515 RepID=A0A172TE66_9BACL|nr:AraC family transcriptional regulator [Paenibacillus swuensis]ANE45339.1 hypothetical protein SY83_02200 [Paenibacillus swuensis]